MASIHSDVLVNVGAEQAWAALREVGNVARLFADVLVDARLDGDLRTVTFANGSIVRERIIDIDEARRRVAYAVLDEPFAHHNASMQILPEAPSTCRFVWISDFLPGSVAGGVAPLIEAGSQAFKRNVEEQSRRSQAEVPAGSGG